MQPKKVPTMTLDEEFTCRSNWLLFMLYVSGVVAIAADIFAAFLIVTHRADFIVCASIMLMACSFFTLVQDYFRAHLASMNEEYARRKDQELQ